MVTLRLPPETERLLKRAAKCQGQSKTGFVREAVVEKLEDIEDAAAADNVMRRLNCGVERTYSLKTVKHGLGL